MTFVSVFRLASARPCERQSLIDSCQRWSSCTKSGSKLTSSAIHVILSGDGLPARICNFSRSTLFVKVSAATSTFAAKRKSGGEVGPEGSITKLMSAEFNQRLQNLALDLEGVGGVAWEGEQAERGQRGRPTWLADGNDRGTLARGFLRAQANTIEGGTSDIMRNILGERVLGLPKDPDVSRDVAWKDVLRSG